MESIRTGSKTIIIIVSQNITKFIPQSNIYGQVLFKHSKI